MLTEWWLRKNLRLRGKAQLRGWCNICEQRTTFTFRSTNLRETGPCGCNYV